MDDSARNSVIKHFKNIQNNFDSISEITENRAKLRHDSRAYIHANFPTYFRDVWGLECTTDMLTVLPWKENSSPAKKNTRRNRLINKYTFLENYPTREAFNAAGHHAPLYNEKFEEYWKFGKENPPTSPVRAFHTNGSPPPLTKRQRRNRAQSSLPKMPRINNGL